MTGKKLDNLKIAILISGRGSNMTAIADNMKKGKLPGLEVTGVFSDVENAPGLELASELGFRAEYLPAIDFKTKLSPREEVMWIKIIQESGAELLCLAGFMKVIKPVMIRAFNGKILNIHPSLLPKYPGLAVQQKALDAGETESGCTVHWVDEGVDTGKILGQKKVPILPGDDAKLLAERILVQEHLLYSEVLSQLLAGEIDFPHHVS
jgi:phosphoribosylglycinamide formyltransferase-1